MWRTAGGPARFGDWSCTTSRSRSGIPCWIQAVGAVAVGAARVVDGARHCPGNQLVDRSRRPVSRCYPDAAQHERDLGRCRWSYRLWSPAAGTPARYRVDGSAGDAHVCHATGGPRSSPDCPQRDERGFTQGHRGLRGSTRERAPS